MISLIKDELIKCSFVLFKMAGFQIYLQLRAMLSQSLRGEIYWHLAFGGFFISIFSRHYQKGKKDEWKIPHCSHCAPLQLLLFSSILFSQKHSSIPQSLQYHIQSFILDFFKKNSIVFWHFVLLHLHLLQTPLEGKEGQMENTALQPLCTAIATSIFLYNFSRKHSSIPQSLQYHFQSFILDFFKDKNLNLQIRQHQKEQMEDTGILWLVPVGLLQSRVQCSF